MTKSDKFLVATIIAGLLIFGFSIGKIFATNDNPASVPAPTASVPAPTASVPAPDVTVKPYKPNPIPIPGISMPSNLGESETSESEESEEFEDNDD